MSETTTWAGSISGAGASTAVVEVTRDGSRIEGQLRLFDPSVGQMHACLVGEWGDDNKLTAKLEQFMGNFSKEMTLPQNGSLEGTFDPHENALRGHWKTDAGVEGDFWWVCVANHPPSANGTSAVANPIAPEHLPLPDITTVKYTPGRPHAPVQKKKKKRWLVIAVGVILAAVVGYFLMDFLINAVLNG